MKNSVKCLSVLSGGLLLGCSQLSLSPAPREPVAGGPAATVLSRGRLLAQGSNVASVKEAEHFWLQGRAAQDQGQLELAREHYAKVLKRQPFHAGALNALGVVHAQSNRLDEAIALFQRALVLEPTASHLFNNLGYALLLAGRLAEAEDALARAHALNPTSVLTQQNRELLAQAKARGAAVKAATGTEASPPRALQEQAALVAVAPQVYELRDPVVSATALATPRPVSRVARAAAAPEPQTKSALRGVRIEVSNGVGIRHMARRTAERLASLGVVAARLTNQPGYRQATTELEFRVGQELAAQALARQFPQAPRMLPSRQLAGDVQLRLVLGHDQVGKAMLAWFDAPVQEPARQADDEAPPPVALNPATGWRWG